MPGDGQGIGVPLSLFGGLCTELSPASAPDGISPDCQDVVFLPGSVSNRPCLQKLFANAFPNSPTVVYEKTFLQPDEEPLNLYLDSVNNFWTENVVTAPSDPVLFTALPYAGGSILQALSATQFGREYIACSDGEHGAAVPLQFDGTYLDRVSQDGPGSNPMAAADLAPPTYNIEGTGAGAEVLNLAYDIASATQNGNICSYQLTNVGSSGFFGTNVPLSQYIQPGDQVNISGLSVSGYNSLQTVVQVADNNVVQTFNPTTGLAPAVPSGTCILIWDYIRVELTTTVSVTQFPLGGNAQIAGSSATGLDGTWVVRDAAPATGSSQTVILGPSIDFAPGTGTGGTLSVPGFVSPGQHQVVVLFLTRQGYITKPSQPISWTSAGGNLAQITVVPLGPSNVVARLIAFTGAGGDNFFYIPENLTLPNPFGPPIVIGATVIADNSTTSATFNFSDNALFGATAIDIDGQNYFNQVVLSDCLGIFPYASRLFWWGERNKIQNLVNMGFEGGYASGTLTTPLGWTVVSSGGTLVNGGAWAGGMAWQITTDALGTVLGELSQPAYQDYLGIPILQPSTQYTFRVWIQTAVVLNSEQTVYAALYSSSQGVLGTAAIALGNGNGFQAGAYVTAQFSAATPAAIPSDTVLQLYATNLTTAAGPITLDEAQLYPTEQPYRDQYFRVSYVNAPEQFDGVSGVLGSTSDPSPIRTAFLLRNTMYFHTVEGLQSTTDNGTGEPSTWSVPEVTQSVGARSVHGSDAGKVGTGESGEQFEFVANENGVYAFSGGETLKVSQEIQAQSANEMPGWDSINKAAIQSLWIKNDIVNRRLYVGAPTGTATAPNVIFVMDYRELNDFAAITGNGPYRQSLQGRLIAVEFCRKWTRWNIAANCGEILARGGGVNTFCVGAGNGQTPGLANGFGNAYQFNAAYLTDDDYGQVTPYYTTYFFVTRDQEQQFQLGGHRKLATYLAEFISGTGQTSITPFADALTNPWPSPPAYPLTTDPSYDLEWPLNVIGERIALQVGSVPLEGQTDNGFNLQHLELTLKPEPMAPVRGAL